MPKIEENQDIISVIITVLNGGPWIDSCMESIIKQTAVQAHAQYLQQQQEEIHLQQEQQIKNKNNEQKQQENTIKLHYNKAQTPFLTTMTSSPNTLLNTTTLTAPNAATFTTTSSTATSCNLPSTSSSLAPLIEVCVFDDCSSDNTLSKLLKWREYLREHFKVTMLIIENETGKSKGVGYGRNRAIEASSGNYLCFQDIDDEMLPERILKQYQLAKTYKNAIIGAKFSRLPSNATCRFTRWANDLPKDKLILQIYTSNGPTIIMPTWLCHRQVYSKISGGFCEEGKGCPEDLIFFYKHLDQKGQIKRVEECLLKYRYHSGATTFSVSAKTIWQIRLQHLLDHVLKKPPWCQGFSIWNAGKQGRKFFRDLPDNIKKQVRQFCDVDKNKINKLYKYYDATLRQTTFNIPIVHFTCVERPVIICMKLDLTNGDFEKNLQSLKFVEGKDYVLFT